MAVIREEMVLADRFSATFNRYLGMLRQSSSASTAATAGQRQFEAASGKTQDALVRMAGAALDAASAMGGVDESTAQAAAAGEQAARSQDKMNRSMRQGVGAAAGLESRLLSLAKAYLGLRTAQKFVELTDTFTQTTARLERMNDGLQTTAELQNMIYQAAQRSRGSYQEMADMVGKLGTMAGEAAQQLDLFQSAAPQKRDKVEALERTMDAIRSKYGRGAVTVAALAPPRSPEGDDGVPF